jgi:hypothetical protein
MLLRIGLGGCIAVSFMQQYSTLIIIPVAIVAPIFLSLFILGSKKFRNIVFKDEKYPEEINGNANLLILFLISIGYIFLITSSYYISENYIFNLDISILLINIIYFGGIFYLFIDKISLGK